MLPPKLLVLALATVSFAEATPRIDTRAARGEHRRSGTLPSRGVRFARNVHAARDGRFRTEFSSKIDPVDAASPRDPPPSSDVRDQQDSLSGIEPPGRGTGDDNTPGKDQNANAVTLDVGGPSGASSVTGTAASTATASGNASGLRPDIGVDGGAGGYGTPTSMPHPTSSDFYGNWKNHSNGGSDDAPPPPAANGQVSSDTVGRVAVAGGAVVIAAVLGVVGLL